MDVAVVGSVALDTVETPWGRNEEGLGGAATFFSLAASYYAPVHLVGVVGEDFPERHIELLQSHGINIDGLERAPGRTFRWTGRYHEDLNYRDTLDTQLNVFEQFHPKLPEAARRAKYLFLGNIHPALQLEVLDQSDAEFIGLDTMNLWIDNFPGELRKVLARVNAAFFNDSEARELTNERNLVRAADKIRDMGPRIVVIKKGEHGCLIFERDGVFCAPAFPLPDVVDPTGAGDSFAGGFMGYVASQDRTDFPTLRRAVVHGSVVASYTCEKFGPDRLAEISTEDIEERYEGFRRLASFWAEDEVPS
jgi:sugar/nucleoside kinase (ribokinase family)